VVRFDASLRNKDAASVYKGQVIYGRGCLSSDLALHGCPGRDQTGRHWDDFAGFLAGIPEVGAWAAELNLPARADVRDQAPLQEGSQQNGLSAERQLSGEGGTVQAGSLQSHLRKKLGALRVPFPEEPAIQAPFLGSRGWMKRRFLGLKVFAYLDRNAFFAGQWQLRKTKNSRPGTELREMLGRESRTHP